ncbi:MAG: amidohydrolase [Tissierellia bacterium]|nr:amidohydrolase [Tissierellia bacterium]
MDLILINGIIATQDKKDSFVEAVAIKDGNIVKVGTTAEMLDFKNEETEVIDLGGKLVLPGFNDSHMHLLNYGNFLKNIDLTGVKSIEEIIQKVKDILGEKNIEKGQWIKGRGWNNDYFQGNNRFPNRYDLDKISTEHPIILTRACGHIAITNSKALELANITKDTKQSIGGEFDIDKNGEPLGIFRENAIELINNIIPEPSVKELKDMLLVAIKKANVNGITSVQTDDFGVISYDNYEKIIKAYEELKKEGKLTLRVYEQCLFQEPNKLERFLGKGYNTGYGDEFFKIGPLKLIADGSLGARTAALTRPYKDAPHTYGIPVFNQEELDNLVDIAHSKGMQVAIHAIGDKAMYMAFESIEKALDKNPKKDHRCGIVHCQITDKYLLNKFKELNVIAYIQPIFLDYDWKIAESRVGSELIKTSYNWKTLIDNKVNIACGSDCPVEDLNVMKGIYEAVTRKDLKGEPIDGWMPEQRLTVQEAVYGYTVGGAYTSFEEDIKGTIEEGKLADMVVLSKNIYKIPHDEIKDIKVEMTIFNGQIVYRK